MVRFPAAIFSSRPFAISLLALAAIVGCSRGAAGTKLALQTTLKLAAAASAAATNQEIATGIHQEWDKVLAPGESLYAVQFSFSRATWSDFWSRPDIFLVIEREGGKRIVIPDIENDWNYTARIFSFRCPTLQPGERCALRVYDDDGTADKVFKSVLQTPLYVEARASVREHNAALGTLAVLGEAKATGKIHLLLPKYADTLELDAPDAIAAAEFQVPRSSAPWSMEGQFQHNGANYGAVTLTHLRAHPLPGFVRNLLTPRLLFWGTLTFGLLVLANAALHRRRHKLTLPKSDS